MLKPLLLLLTMTACGDPRFQDNGSSCDEAGMHGCDGDATILCVCPDIERGEACDDEGIWQLQTTTCDSCDDWLASDCP